MSTLGIFQANYINALAVSVLRPFEPAGLITLGELYFTLGELVFTFHLTIFNIIYTFNVRSNLYRAASKKTRVDFF
jgi:hypothetical protein